MSERDERAAQFYSDPESREAGPGEPEVPRRRKGLTDYVRVRFPTELLAAVKVLAAQDGRTVSSWVRNVIAVEVEERSPVGPETRQLFDPSETTVEWDSSDIAHGNVTHAS